MQARTRSSRLSYVPSRVSCILAMFRDTTSFRVPSDNAQCIICRFKAKHAPVQRVCFNASSMNVCYFVRDWWSEYQADTLLQGSTAMLGSYWYAYMMAAKCPPIRPAAHSETDERRLLKHKLSLATS